MKLLSESTTVPVKTDTRGRWRAVFLTEGHGSSGNWLRETIERDGPAALPKGSRCFVTHNRLENGEPDPFRMWGVLAEDAQYDGDGKLIGEIDILPSWIDRVEEVAPHTALSVYLMGESDDNGNITKIFQDAQNGVDMVVHPGREGSSLVEKLYESATPAGSEKRTVTEAGENGSKNMELEAKVDKALELLAALATDKAEKAAEAAQVTADAEAAKVAAEGAVAHYSAAVEAVDAADLFESQRKDILAQAAKGEDVSALIESAKTVKAEALEAVKESAEQDGTQGVVLGESATKFGAWA